jgi:alpha-L-fucosidase
MARMLQNRCQGDMLCLHVFNWPADGVLRLPTLPRQVRHAQLLADPAGALLRVTQTADGLTVEGPAHVQDPIDSVVPLTGS